MYKLRRATQDDYSFAYNLIKTNMKDYAVRIWGTWNEDFQEKFFKNYFSTKIFQIIVVENKDVGIIALDKNKTAIIIYEIHLLPQYQRKGIGSLIFSDIIKIAQKENLEITLKVLKINFAAQKFYNKFGFEKYGETETHFLLKKKPFNCFSNYYCS